MDQCGCDDGFASIFDRKTAEADRERYRRDGPDATTRMLLDMIIARGVEGATVLDIGGGTGLIARELIRAGAESAVLVDGSVPFIEVAREEAATDGMADRMNFVQGDFVARSDVIEPADIVTLDRVICCYSDVEALVSLSGDRATRLYGLVLPRDGWYVRLAIRLNNLLFILRRSPYRSYAHPNRQIDSIAKWSGLTRIAERRTMFWRVVLYAARADD